MVVIGGEELTCAQYGGEESESESGGCLRVWSRGEGLVPEERVWAMRGNGQRNGQFWSVEEMERERERLWAVRRDEEGKGRAFGRR